MAGASQEHDDVVRREFTQQAEAYAALPTVTDSGRLLRLVEAVRPTPEAAVLDVATGPGYVAMAFAERCREVVGIDLTGAPIALAEAERQRRGLDNLRFAVGEAQRLAFADSHCDVVVCRLALHHFERPGAVLREMVRVCRVGGTVAVEDLVASEHPARAAYHNQFERLRDPSHTRALPLSELLALFAAAGLEVETVSTDRSSIQVERWLGTSQTPPDRAAEVRALLERDQEHDLSGVRPFYQEGALAFTHRMATVVGRKLAPLD